MQRELARRLAGGAAELGDFAGRDANHAPPSELAHVAVGVPPARPAVVRIAHRRRTHRLDDVVVIVHLDPRVAFPVHHVLPEPGLDRGVGQIGREAVRRDRGAGDAVRAGPEQDRHEPYHRDRVVECGHQDDHEECHQHRVDTPTDIRPPGAPQLRSHPLVGRVRLLDQVFRIDEAGDVTHRCRSTGKGVHCPAFIGTSEPTLQDGAGVVHAARRSNVSVSRISAKTRLPA